MLNKLLANKKIVIIAIALFVAVCIGAVILITSSSKETGGKDTDTKTEHGNEDNKVNDEEDDDTGLEVLKPDQTTPENSSDASGSWDDEPESNTQTDNANTTDKTDESNQTENEGSDENPEKDEDILKDDNTWGDIY